MRLVGPDADELANLRRREGEVVGCPNDFLSPRVCVIAVIADDGVVIGRDHGRRTFGKLFRQISRDHLVTADRMSLKLSLQDIAHVVVVLDQAAHEVPIFVESDELRLRAITRRAYP